MRFLTVAFLLTGPAFAGDTDQQRGEQIFATYDKADSPGCALGVIQNRAFIYRKGYGVASPELGVPLSS